ncbi:MAG: hypothetical protein JSW28_06915 [Thermoplasmata archaeon]|nr:MAG: hypothetical protein JSW28_06915 [Thermoplasmata archaeon]
MVAISMFLFLDSNGCRAQETESKAAVKFQSQEREIDYHPSSADYVIITGSVHLNLSGNETAYAELEADAGGWYAALSPVSFFAGNFSNIHNFTVTVFIPKEAKGGVEQTLNVTGNLTMLGNASGKYKIEADSMLIRVNPYHSVGMEFSHPFIQLGPSQKVSFSATVNNFGGAGLYEFKIKHKKRLEENRWEVRIEPSQIYLPLGEQRTVNMTVRAPDYWVIWADYVEGIGINISEANGTVLETAWVHINVRGYYIGGFEWVCCPLITIVIAVMIVQFIKGALKEPKTTYPGKNIQLLRLKKRKMKMEIIMKRIDEKIKSLEEQDEEDSSREIPSKECPVCSSADVRPHLLGKYKCNSCGHFFGK